MPIHSLYKDFFRFIEAFDKGEDIFQAYQDYYFKPHEKFLTSYWKHFKHFDEELIEKRVKIIKKGDYALLQSILMVEKPEELCRNALKRCLETAESFKAAELRIPEPDIYLFIGFFSADGVTFMLDDVPVIGFGLERYKSLREMPILIAHEFSHYLDKIEPGFFRTKKTCEKGTLGELLLSEGLAFHFSMKAFPQRKVMEHLFLRRDVYNWCVEEEEMLMKEIEPRLDQNIEENSLYDIEREKDLIPRSLNYAAFKLAESLLISS